MKRLVPFIFIFLTGCRACNRHGGENFQIVNLSLPRSGTTSFAQIFLNHNSTHEFMMADTVFATVDFREGKISRTDLTNLLKRRAQIAKHSVDSATFLFLEPEIVIETFPDAKFFFALRPCEDWTVSMIDRFNTLYRMKRAGVNLENIRYMDRFGTIFSPYLSPDVFTDVPTIQKHAAKLVRDLTQFWSRSSIRVMENMLKLKPAQRLVIHLKDMDHSLEIFSAFSGVPLSSLNSRQTHTNKDTHSRETRAVIGENLLRHAAATEQRRVDLWLNAHPELFISPLARNAPAPDKQIP